MTEQEFAQIAYLIKNGWPGQYGKDNVAAYADFLLGCDFAQTKAALRKLAAEGTKFVPSVGQIIAAIGALDPDPVPSWAEAWAQIQKMIARAGRWYGDVPGEQIAPYSLPAARYGKGIAHPAVVAFVEEAGLRNLGMLPVYDQEHGELRLRRLAEGFTEFVQVQQDKERVRSSLAAAGVGQVASDEPRELTA